MYKLSLLAGLAALIMFSAVQSGAAQGQGYTGIITASQIASTGNVGIWMKKLNCHDERECARRLVRAGGKYVLVTNKGVYPLSDASKADLFAGMRVTVTGAYDSKKKIISVTEVQAYPTACVSASVN